MTRLGSHAPLIGVSTSEVRLASRARPSAHSEPPRRELALGIAYLEAIERAGGIPVILSPLRGARTEALLDRLDGLCLSGGPDLEPAAYGHERHPELGPTEPDLDRFELALARGAQERGLPVLGICRGLQVLNVACGGTLLQHLPDQLADPHVHRTPEPDGDTARHAIAVAPGSLLEEVLGAGRHEVNSYHHQAVARLGAGLRVSAWADDGTVEAVEGTGDGLALAVQWHAECMPGEPAQRALFEALVDAAAGRSASPLERAA